MTELIFKFPEKKPPFFGIKFEVENDANTINQNWLKLTNKQWDARFEVNGEKINLTLYCKKELKHTYFSAVYDKGALKKFLRLSRQSDTLNFGHVISDKDGKDKIARTPIDNKPWVLPINKIEIYNINGPGNLINNKLKSINRN